VRRPKLPVRMAEDIRQEQVIFFHRADRQNGNGSLRLERLFARPDGLTIRIRAAACGRYADILPMVVCHSFLLERQPNPSRYIGKAPGLRRVSDRSVVTRILR